MDGGALAKKPNKKSGAAGGGTLASAPSKSGDGSRRVVEHPAPRRKPSATSSGREDAGRREELHRKAEKRKIRLEEHGVGGGGSKSGKSSKAQRRQREAERAEKERREREEEEARIKKEREERIRRAHEAIGSVYINPIEAARIAWEADILKPVGDVLKQYQIDEDEEREVEEAAERAKKADAGDAAARAALDGKDEPPFERKPLPARMSISEEAESVDRAAAKRSELTPADTADVELLQQQLQRKEREYLKLLDRLSDYAQKLNIISRQFEAK